MGSRGRMLSQAHWNLPGEYKCVDLINDIKVLEYQGSNKHHNKLPDISHTKGTTYMLKNKDGTFHQLRIYDYSGRPKVDIDYGVHGQFGGKPTLHIHNWKGSRVHGDPNTTRLFTKKDYVKYKKYLKGVIKDEWVH